MQCRVKFNRAPDNLKENTMKTKNFFLTLLIMTSMHIAATPAIPAWLKQAVFYQIYPPSFQDSNGDGIGDIRGIISRLDYIRSLGANTIWLNPLFCSEFKDGGYDVTDFYSVDKRYGTNSDLAELVNEAHKRDIRVCLDLVAGHTSDKNPWFIQSQQADPNRRYSDYYIWPAFIPDDISEWAAGKYIPSDAPRGNYYIKNFYACQPALNYGYANPDPSHPWEQPVDAPGPQAVRREMKNIIAFWMDKGIDGFRVDMAMSLVKNDPDKKGTMQLWHDMKGWFAGHYPEGVLIAEWFNPTEAIAGGGFHIDFIAHAEKDNYTSLFFNREGGEFEPRICYFDREGKGELRTFMEMYSRHYEAVKGKGYASLPTGNHDFQRPNCHTRNTLPQLQVAMTFFLTMPGAPFIYYGDEIGMKFLTGLPDVEGSLGEDGKNRAGTRTPMQWDDSPNAGFSTADASRLYIVQDPDPLRPTVAAQENDPGSMLNYVRRLLKMRSESEALGNDGDWKLLSDVNRPYPLVYLRSAGNERYCIVVNPSDRRVTAEFPSLQSAGADCRVATAAPARYIRGKKTDKVTAPPVSATIFKLE